MLQKKSETKSGRKPPTKSTTGLPSVEQLFDARVHLGHQSRRWSPLMEPYIFSKTKKTHLIDLEKTMACLREATTFLKSVKKKKGRVIFVGTKRQAKDLIEKYAKSTDSYYINQRWVGGILTNFDNCRKNLEQMHSIKEGLKQGRFSDLTKKERLLIKRRLRRNERLLGGLAGMGTLPSALVIVDPRRERVALQEALRMKITTVALVDTNTDPSGVDYVIPGNDDAISALDLIIGTLAKALK